MSSTSNALNTPTIDLTAHEQPLRALATILRDAARRQQVSEAQRHLLRPRHVLVSGAAGTGKTALIRRALTDSEQPYVRLSAAGWLRDIRELPSAECLLRQARSATHDDADVVLWIDDIHALVVNEEDERASAARAIQRELVRLVEDEQAGSLLLVLSGASSGGKAPDLYPDLIARLVAQVPIEPLGENDLVALLGADTLPFAARYIALAAADGITLAFDEDAFVELAAIANDLNARHDDIGAHRLPALLERVVADLWSNDDEKASTDTGAATGEVTTEAADEDTTVAATDASAETTHTVTADMVAEKLADLLEEDDLDGAIL